MEIRSLSSQNVLIKTDRTSLLVVPQTQGLAQVMKEQKDVKIVLAFSETTVKTTNRDVLICDWPGEYERSDTSIIGLHEGAFVVAIEGKHWLVIADTALETLDHENEHLNNVEGLLIWISASIKKDKIQDAIANISPSYIVYCVSAENEVVLKDFVPPPLAAVSELIIKPSELDSESEQIKAQALIV